MAKQTNESFGVGGTFHIEHIRNGVVIDKFDAKNVVTDEGVNHVLNVTFAAATQVGTWYVGIFKNDYTPVTGDTAASFPAAAGEATTEYSEGTRQTYTEATSTAKSITNTANKAVFTFAASASIRGAMLSSVATKGSTSGILMAAAKFSAAKSVESGDQLAVTYTINGSSV